VNTTLIHGKQLAAFDTVVLDTLSHIEPRTHHPAEKRLLIGIQNERGEVYRIITIFGLISFFDLIGKFRKLGFTDELAQHAGEKEGYDAVLSMPAST
jgi:predicted Zn-dependent protease with MMP-like domain